MNIYIYRNNKNIYCSKKRISNVINFMKNHKGCLLYEIFLHNNLESISKYNVIY